MPLAEPKSEMSKQWQVVRNKTYRKELEFIRERENPE